MKNRSLCIGIIITGLLIILLSLYFYQYSNSFIGLNPIATYKEYKIYDLVRQKGLACAEAIEILDSDESYDYYFECLKSNKIYFISNKETLNVKDAYKRGIITKEELCDLGIVGRMVKINEK
jgi:hypothetical protein